MLGGNKIDHAAVTRPQGGDRTVRLVVTRRLRPRCCLAGLSDKTLHALLVRIQSLLLDRPHNGHHLAVEVVHDHEARLLAAYRALPEERRWEVLALAERYLATSRQHHTSVPCAPASPAPAGDAGAA
jgi:hypothetical protein